MRRKVLQTALQYLQLGPSRTDLKTAAKTMRKLSLLRRAIEILEEVEAMASPND